MTDFSFLTEYFFLPQITQIFKIFSFLFDALSCYARITPFGRDYCFVRHNSSKLDSAITYRKKSRYRLSQIRLRFARLIIVFNIFNL